MASRAVDRDPKFFLLRGYATRSTCAIVTVFGVLFVSDDLTSPAPLIGAGSADFRRESTFNDFFVPSRLLPLDYTLRFLLTKNHYP